MREEEYQVINHTRGSPVLDPSPKLPLSHRRTLVLLELEVECLLVREGDSLVIVGVEGQYQTQAQIAKVVEGGMGGVEDVGGDEVAEEGEERVTRMDL